MNRIVSGGKPNTDTEAEQLNKMIRMPLPSRLLSLLRWRRRMGIAGVHPNRNSYNAVMKAYTNARGTRGEDRISNVERILFPA